MKRLICSRQYNLLGDIRLRHNCAWPYFDFGSFCGTFGMAIIRVLLYKLFFMLRKGVVVRQCLFVGMLGMSIVWLTRKSRIRLDCGIWIAYVRGVHRGALLFISVHNSISLSFLSSSCILSGSHIWQRAVVCFLGCPRGSGRGESSNRSSIVWLWRWILISRSYRRRWGWMCLIHRDCRRNTCSLPLM